MTMDVDAVGPAKRWPRFVRHRFRKPSLVLQPRDYEIVQLVAGYRVVTSDDLRALVAGSDQAILRRLQKLYHAGYLDRPRRQRHRGNQPFVYALGQAGAAVVGELTGDAALARADWTEKNRQLQARYLEHALMISRFHAVLQIACERRGDVVLESWRADGVIRDRAVLELPHGPVPVCPDALFVLRLRDEPIGRNRIHCFLEADRGTMTLKRFRTKAEGYWQYWRTGQVTERLGIKNFLVVTIARTAERAGNLRAITQTLDAPLRRGLRMFLFGAADQYALTEPLTVLNPIWMTAGDDDRHSLLE